MQNSFATRVTAKTVKGDSSIARLIPLNEAVKNAIDANAKNIFIYIENCENDKIIGESLSLIVEDDGNGFDCMNDRYMNDRWTHYKGGDYRQNKLGGKSRGRYSYLKFIDYDESKFANIKLYTRARQTNNCITFGTDKNNIVFISSDKQANYKNEYSKTQLNVSRLGEKFVDNRDIEKLIGDLEKSIIVEFADKIIKNICISINDKQIEVGKYIDDKIEQRTYSLTNGEEFVADMIVWNNEIDLADKKHTFLFNKQGNCLGKLNSGSRKSIFNCHTVFLTSDIFREDSEMIEINLEYQKIIDEVQEKYKDDLDKLLFKSLLKNRDNIANNLLENSELLHNRNDIDNMVKEKINEAYKILTLPLIINGQNINKKNVGYISNSLLGIISENHSNTLTNLELVFKLDAEQQKILSYVKQNMDILTLIKQYYDIIRKLDFLEHFENLVLDEGKDKTKERTELHKVVENNLWIFGDEYADLPLVFSDRALSGIFKEIGLPTDFNNIKELNKIPDIFIPRTKDKKLLLIELKAPKVEITKKILDEVFEKYVITILRALQKQSNEIEFIKTICISSTKQEYITTFSESNYKIQAMTWREIITDRRQENKERLKNIEHSLSLSHYTDLEDFKNKEINNKNIE